MGEKTAHGKVKRAKRVESSSHAGQSALRVAHCPKVHLEAFLLAPPAQLLYPTFHISNIHVEARCEASVTRLALCKLSVAAACFTCGSLLLQPRLEYSTGGLLELSLKWFTVSGLNQPVSGVVFHATGGANV